MEAYKKSIAEMLSKVLKKKENELIEFLEQPPAATGADYAFPCYILAKEAKRSPLDLANELAAELKPTKLIVKVESKGPYVNFFLNKEMMADIIFSLIKKEKDAFGSLGVKKKNALIEHTSINPNSPPHVGRARNAIIGDSLTRLLRFHGYKTEVHFFVNDIGKQIAMLVYALEGKKTPKFDEIIQTYIEISKRVENDKELEQKIFLLLAKLEQGDAKTRARFRQVVDLCINGQVAIFSDLGIKYDFFDYESSYLFSKKTAEVLALLHKCGKVFTDSDGREVLDLDGFDLPMKDKAVFVLTRGDKTSLYGLRDIAYTLYKLKRAAEKNIVVLGEDHKLYFRQLAATLSLLSQKAPEPVHYSFVLLSEGKMSTRSGNVILLEDFMREAEAKAAEEIRKRNAEIGEKDLQKLARIIGYGALKFSLLRISPEKNVLFNWDKALSFEGESAPYIQYAYARIMSILRKSNAKLSAKPDTSLLTHEKEKELVSLLSEFPSITKTALAQLRPHFIANYAQRLAEKFNEFYHECPVLTEEAGLSGARLTLIIATAQVLKNSMHILGIEMPEKM